MRLLLIMKDSDATKCFLRIFKANPLINQCDHCNPDLEKIVSNIRLINRDYTHIVVKSCSDRGRGAECYKYLAVNFQGRLIETDCCGYNVQPLPDKCLPFNMAILNDYICCEATK